MSKCCSLEKNLESRRVLNEKFQFELTVKDKLIYYITEGTREVLKRSVTSENIWFNDYLSYI